MLHINQPNIHFEKSSFSPTNIFFFLFSKSRLLKSCTETSPTADTDTRDALPSTKAIALVTRTDHYGEKVCNVCVMKAMGGRGGAPQPGLPTQGTRLTAAEAEHQRPDPLLPSTRLPPEHFFGDSRYTLAFYDV